MGMASPVQMRQSNKCGGVRNDEMIVSIQCNLVDNQYQQNPEVLYTFTPCRSYAYLLKVERSNLVFLKTYNRV